MMRRIKLIRLFNGTLDQFDERGVFEGTPAQFEDCFGGFGDRDPTEVVEQVAEWLDVGVEITYE